MAGKSGTLGTGRYMYFHDNVSPNFTAGANGSPRSGPVDPGLLHNYRKLYEAPRIDPLRGLLEVFRLRPEDALDEGLRIPVIQREPARLHLDHHPVARQEDVVRRRQRPLVNQRLPGDNGLRYFEALPIASPENIGRHHELVTAHQRLAHDFIGID